jgi:hypothetical protein
MRLVLFKSWEIISEDWLVAGAASVGDIVDEAINDRDSDRSLVS